MGLTNSDQEGLNGVSPVPFSTNTTPSAAEWTKKVAGITDSPDNPTSIVGRSPLSQPSSCEDQRQLSRWSSPQQIYMGMPPVEPTVTLLSPSPTEARPIKRPLSFQLDRQHVLLASDSHRERRNSVYSQFSAHPRTISNPPISRQPQSPFPSSTDFDLKLGSQSGMKAGDRGYHFGFDILPVVGDHGRGSENVIVTGYEGGVDIYSIAKQSVNIPLVSLRGLRGGIINAKILPYSSPGPEDDIYLLAVVHGPAVPQKSREVDGSLSPPADRAATPTHTIGESVPKQGTGFVIEYYQTTVDIYSLKTGALVETILEAPKVRLTNAVQSPIFQVPPPTGSFHLRAEGDTMVVASGQSGECWLYRYMVISPGPVPHFLCIAKLWTCLQPNPKTEAPNDADSKQYSPKRCLRTDIPIIALQGRWVAYCPANPSSQIAIGATVPVSRYGKAPGINSVTPPQLPLVSAEIDLREGSSVVNKLLRETTQEFIVGAKWVSQHSMRIWSEYWNKNSQQARSPTSTQQPGNWQRQEAVQFPPTHGTSSAPPANKDPGLVSIVDVSLIGLSSNVHPIITFLPPLGCSFLSFTPNGLALFTVTTKGDVQTLWDLLRIQSAKSSPLQASLIGTISGPQVRQIAQFSRMTVARIIDVAWAKPAGELLAVVTERGTVHIHELSPSTFAWPPPHKKISAQGSSRNSVSEGSNTATSAAISIASSALSTAASVARPLIIRSRRGSLQAGVTASGTSLVDQASHSGRALAASISSSLGKTGYAINQLRHTGENRVALPSFAQIPASSCVVWISSRKHQTLFVLGNGVVRQYPRKKRCLGSKKSMPKGLYTDNFRDISVPVLPDDQLAPLIKKSLDPKKFLNPSDRDKLKTLVLETRSCARQQGSKLEPSIPQAEIESSAPYQPFHTDHRISIFSYNAIWAKNSKIQGRVAVPQSVFQQWIFGEAIDSIKLEFEPGQEDCEDFDEVINGSCTLLRCEMERIMQLGENQEQIVITTRRRRGVARNPTGAGTHANDNGLFEEDCVVLDFADQRV